jgi:flagellar biosynthesis protein FliQ
MNGPVIEQALRLAVAQVLPVALAAGGAALLVGLVAQRFGLHDPTLVLLARAAAVLAMLAAGGPGWLVDTAAWTGELWTQIAVVGQGGR